MKWNCTAAAAIVAASMVILGGCAAPEPESTRTADAKNPCLGVAPATGSLVRRKEDCGAPRAQDDQAKQMMIDQIRSQPGLTGTTSKPGG